MIILNDLAKLGGKTVVDATYTRRTESGCRYEQVEILFEDGSVLTVGIQDCEYAMPEFDAYLLEDMSNVTPNT